MNTPDNTVQLDTRLFTKEQIDTIAERLGMTREEFMQDKQAQSALNALLAISSEPCDIVHKVSPDRGVVHVRFEIDKDGGCYFVETYEDGSESSFLSSNPGTGRIRVLGPSSWSQAQLPDQATAKGMVIRATINFGPFQPGSTAPGPATIDWTVWRP